MPESRRLFLRGCAHFWTPKVQSRACQPVEIHPAQAAGREHQAAAPGRDQSCLPANLIRRGREQRYRSAIGSSSSSIPEGLRPEAAITTRAKRVRRLGFPQHFHGRISDFDSKARVRMRGPAGHAGASRTHQVLGAQPGQSAAAVHFYLQKATGRFYPDFVCVLNDGKILVVEYKGRTWLDGCTGRPGHRRTLGRAQRRYVPVRDGAESAVGGHRGKLA